MLKLRFRRLSRMIARLPEEMGLPLDVAKRRARKVVTRVSLERQGGAMGKSIGKMWEIPGEVL